jgi:ribosomal protein S18 acetylase RimI-like enzyme
VTGDGLVLRVLTEDDWELWRALRLEALAEAPYAFSSRLDDWSSAPEERWRARLRGPDVLNLVASVDGRPAGMASGVPGDEPDTVEVISMWIDPATRGCGVADTLVRTIERWAGDRGALTLRLGVFELNARARALYARLGLVVVGAEDRSSPDEPLELVMAKRVTPG